MKDIPHLPINHSETPAGQTVPGASVERPQRLHRSSKAGSRLVSPNGLPIIYVGRPTKWGNPFTTGSREARVTAYREKLMQGFLCEDFATEMISDELAGKNLACWCPLDVPCHADVLLAMANGWPLPFYETAPDTAKWMPRREFEEAVKVAYGSGWEAGRIHSQGES
jgi:hypothetical protein